MLKRWLGWSGGWRAWTGALSVLVVTGVLVALDLSVGSVHRYGSEHSFATSVLSGVLVLLLTVLIVDRVSRIRRLRDQSRAIAAQAAVVLAQAARAKDAATRSSASDDDRDEASGELRSYTQMLLISAPLLIDAKVSRTFLEAAQRVALQLSRAIRATDAKEAREAKTRLDRGVEQMREAAGPLLQALNRDQQAAVNPDEGQASALPLHGPDSAP